MPSSRLKVEIARILESEGYIQGFKVLEPSAGERVQAQLRMFMKCGPRGERVISGIQRVEPARTAASTSDATRARCARRTRHAAS